MVSENFVDKRGGVSRSSVENFFLTTPKNFLGGVFDVSEKNDCRNFLRIRRRYHYFPLNIFCLKVLKKISGSLSMIRKTSGIKKFHGCEGMGVIPFLLKKFCLRVPKVFVGNLSLFRKNSGSGKFYAEEGISRCFLWRFLFQYQKICRWTLCVCVSVKFGYQKSFWVRGGRGVITFFVEFFLSHSAEKHHGGTLQCFPKLLGTKKFFLIKLVGERGVSITVFCPVFCLTVPKLFVRGYFTWLRKILLSNFFLDKKRGELYHVPTSIFFCLTMPKSFVAETFCASESFGYR